MVKYIGLLVILGLLQASLALDCYECNESTETECKQIQSIQKCSKPIAPDSVTACELKQNGGKVSKKCAIVKRSDALPECRLQRNPQGVEMCSCTNDLCNNNAVAPSTPSTPQPTSTKPMPSSATIKYLSYIVVSGMFLTVLGH